VKKKKGKGVFEEKKKLRGKKRRTHYRNGKECTQVQKMGFAKKGERDGEGKVETPCRKAMPSKKKVAQNWSLRAKRATPHNRKKETSTTKNNGGKKEVSVTRGQFWG